MATAPNAVILAGGNSSRFGSAKAGAAFGEGTLLGHMVQLTRDAGLQPAVVARPDTALPESVSAPVLFEAARQVSPHPLFGVAHALRALARPLVFVAVDLPLLPPDALNVLARSSAPAALLGRDGIPAALAGRATPELVGDLEAAARGNKPALRTLLSLGAELIDLDDLKLPRTVTMNANTPGDLRAAAQSLGATPR